MKYVIIFLTSYIIISTVGSCIKNSNDDSLDFENAEYIAIDTSHYFPEPANHNPCDTNDYFEPLAYGSMLRTIPGTWAITIRKDTSWSIKTFAFSRIPPNNYQQDSLRERVFVADTNLINRIDTFYICRLIRR